MTVDLITLRIGDIIKIRSGNMFTVTNIKIHETIPNHIAVTTNFPVMNSDGVYRNTSVYMQNGLLYGSYSSSGDIVEIIPLFITTQGSFSRQWPSGAITNEPTNPQHYKSENSKQLWDSTEEQSTHLGEKEISKFRVGDKVYSIQHGIGVVLRIEDSAAYPLIVRFSKFQMSHDISGKLYTEDINPTLLTLEEAQAMGYNIPKQKNKKATYCLDKRVYQPYHSS